MSVFVHDCPWLSVSVCDCLRLSQDFVCSACNCLALIAFELFSFSISLPQHKTTVSITSIQAVQRKACRSPRSIDWPAWQIGGRRGSNGQRSTKVSKENSQPSRRACILLLNGEGATSSRCCEWGPQDDVDQTTASKSRGAPTFQTQEIQGTHLPRNQTPEGYVLLGIEAGTKRERETQQNAAKLASSSSTTTTTTTSKKVLKAVCRSSLNSNPHVIST